MTASRAGRASPISNLKSQISNIKDSADNPLPRWRGFNLQEMFTVSSREPFREDEFRWIADWGFDFVRLPLCYTLWTDGGDPWLIREDGFERLDQAVAWGEKHGIHVCLALHRAPGYSVNPERREPFDLWRDIEALRAFAYHWAVLSRRYAEVPARWLSYNLFNEPPPMRRHGAAAKRYGRLIDTAEEVIRDADPEKRIIIDGTHHGARPFAGALPPGICQSCRGYAPFGLTHYRVPWVKIARFFPRPRWPWGWHFARPWGLRTLERSFEPWRELVRNGIGVHCGETGASPYAPHGVVLAWMRDTLGILREAGIGWALWNLRGPFGILDSGRADVDYADWRGHKLDREMLELLREG